MTDTKESPAEIARKKLAAVIADFQESNDEPEDYDPIVGRALYSSADIPHVTWSDLKALATPETLENFQNRMTLRDYFAGQAMTREKLPVDYIGVEETKRSYRDYASKMYRVADAMLAERAKKEGR